MKRKSQAMLVTAALSAAPLTAGAAPLVSDTFPYADGALETTSGGLWEVNSGTGSKFVVSNKLVIDDNNTSDYMRQYTGPTSVSTGTVYSSFTANFSSTDPCNTQGSYFAALTGPKSGTTFSTFFRARVGSFLAPGQAAGQFTLALSNGGAAANTMTAWGTPLNFDTEYTIVTAYDIGAGTSKMWVNPIAESDPSITASDTASTGALGSYLWRVCSNVTDGDKTVDNLNVATSFAEVIPEPVGSGLALAGGLAALLKRRKR